MEHVGVGEDVLGVVAGPVALLPGAVAVVGRDPDVEPQVGQAGHLVLGERLRRGDVQHGGAALTAATAALSQCRDRRQLVGQRLARRGAGGQHDVTAVPCGVGGRDLVSPGPVHAATGVGRPDLVGDPVRPVGPAGGPRRQHLEVGQPLRAPRDVGEPGHEFGHGAPGPSGCWVHAGSLTNAADTPFRRPPGPVAGPVLPRLLTQVDARSCIAWFDNSRTHSGTGGDGGSPPSAQLSAPRGESTWT